MLPLPRAGGVDRLSALRSALYLLQIIFPDRRSRAQSALDVLGMNDVSLLRVVRPNSGIAVRLQFYVDREMIPFGGFLLHQVLDLLLSPQNVLNMMPEFMRNHIRLSEIGGASSKP